MAPRRPADAVRRFLRARGSPAHVVEEGLEGLVRGWEETVERVAAGYPLDTIEDYLNDLDGRQLLDEALPVASPRAGRAARGRVEVADARFHALATPTTRCLWGDRAAEEHGWSIERNWWYWSRPREAGADLQREIDEALRAPGTRA